jgi:hypothetical protein
VKFSNDALLEETRAAEAKQQAEEDAARRAARAATPEGRAEAGHVHHFAHHLGVTAWTPRYPVVTIFSGKEPLRTSQKRLSSR